MPINEAGSVTCEPSTAYVVDSMFPACQKHFGETARLIVPVGGRSEQRDERLAPDTLLKQKATASGESNKLDW